MDTNKKGPTLEADPKTDNNSILHNRDDGVKAESLFITNSEFAAMLGIAESVFHQRRSEGAIGPEAVRLGRGRAVRWLRLEVEDWIYRGRCCSRAKWQSQQTAKGGRR